MRFVLASSSMFLALFSVFVDYVHPRPDGRLCSDGFCRFDQILSSMSPTGDATQLAALANEDPANPFVWCAYGEFLDSRGDFRKASAAINHAVALGPDMPPVLMRAANFAFTHNQPSEGFALAKRILSETDGFDQILFSYLTHSGTPSASLLGVAVPALPRPARSWMAWLGSHGSDVDVVETWRWMRENHLADQKTAVDLAWALWRRQSYVASQKIWTDWLGSARGDYPDQQLLANTRFQSAFNGSPFDWSVIKTASVQISPSSPDHGLEIRFSGAENIYFANVRQLTCVRPGRYRFSADIQSEDLTTDQSVYFHIFDSANPGGFSVQTPQIHGTVARSPITLDFTVPPETRALAVQLERNQSQRFDNKIQGTLHIYEVSLVPGGLFLK
jgi:hypothetical protein